MKVNILFLLLLSGCSTWTVAHRRGVDAGKTLEYYEANRATLNPCLEHALQGKKAQQGDVVLEWSVNPQGSVIDSRIKERTLENVEVESCLLNHVRSLQFPPSVGKGTATIEFRYNFSDTNTKQVL